MKTYSYNSCSHVQSSFDDSDVNDAFFSLLSHLLGYGLNATSWCDEKASVVDKIRAHGVDTEESAFFGLNGGCFVICGQGRAGNRSTFLAYTPVDIDLEKDIIIRPENSLSLSMRSVKLRARPVSISLILRERIDPRIPQPWTDCPLGRLTNYFKLRGQALTVGIQKLSVVRSSREGLADKSHFDFDLA